MKKKILLWSIVAILILGIAGVAAGAFWWLRRPQVITFSNGDKLTLLSVEYGKKHAPPGVKPPTTTNAVPRAMRGRAGPFTTPTDTLVLWVRQEHEPNQYANFQYYVYDKANTACVESYGNGGSQQASQIVSIQLPAFPRRQGKFIVRVQENSNAGQEVSDQKFIISNPARGSFSAWTAEPLPDAQDDGDLSATLTKLVFGADSNMNRDQDNPDDPMNKAVQATFNVSYKGKPVTNWQPVSIETSDATGNHIGGFASQNQWQDNDDVTTYQWGLWPDEAAWKLRVEFSQQSDFADSELWSAQNIPLADGRQQDFYNYGNTRRGNTNNPVFAETDLNGFHLKIFTPKQFTDAGQGSYLQGGMAIQVTPSLPNDMRMTIVKLTDDQTNDIENMNQGWSGGGAAGNTYRYGLRNLGGATNLNLTIALHQSHFIEFTAKPVKATAAAAQ